MELLKQQYSIHWLESGYTYEDNMRYNVYGSANMYYASKLSEIKLNMLADG